MRTFSIAELEQYSLIKAHTIRVWEKRFGFLKGKRTATNIRYYSLDELTFLLDFSILNRFGNKVSDIACLDKKSLQKSVSQLGNKKASQENQINQLISSMFSLNIEDFEFVLDTSVQTWGIDQTVKQIIVPFIERLEFFSYKGKTTSDYHFVVTAIRKKLMIAIDQAKPQDLVAKSALLFLPEGEHYDLLLLYMNYELRKSGLNVLYLGTNISTTNLLEVIETKQPQFVVMYITSINSGSITKQLLDLFREENKLSYFITTAKPVVPNALYAHNVKIINYKQVSSEVISLV